MASSRWLRFGVCGLGFMGRQYFSIVRRHDRAEVVAVCDADADRLAGKWDDAVGNLDADSPGPVDMAVVAGYGCADDLLKDDCVDAVAITLPTHLHADLTVRALDAGKHVLCEKPMALSLAECDRMIDAARRSGRTLMIAQCIRFWPQYELIKRLVDEGRIGPVRCATLRRLGTAPGWAAGGWLMNGDLSGGALFDLHVHDIDFVQHLMGVPATVHARGSRGPSGAIDHVIATYGYDNGRYACIEGAWTLTPPWPFDMSITVQGESGTLDWSMARGPDVLLFGGDKEPERLAVEDTTGWVREIDYFVACAAENRAVDRCPPSESRTSIALALAERESIERGGVLVGQPGN